MNEPVTWAQVGAVVGIGFIVVVVLWVLYRVLSAYGDAWTR